MQSVVQIQQSQASVQRKTIFQNVLKQESREFIWFIKMCCTKFIQVRKNDLNLLKINGDQSDSDQLLKHFTGRISLKLDSNWPLGKSFKECWFLLFQSAWPSQKCKRENVFWKCLDLMKHCLNEVWQESLLTTDWLHLFEESMETTNAWSTFSMKCTLPSILARSACAVSKIIAACTEYYPKISDLNARSVFWSLNISKNLFLLAVCMFEPIARHFLSKTKWFSVKFLVDYDGIGLNLLRVGWFLHFGVNSHNKFEHCVSYYNTILPLMFIGGAKRILRIPEPKWLNWNSIKARQWHYNRQENHDTNKYSMIPVLVAEAICQECSDVISKKWGSIAFNDGLSFESSILLEESANASIGKLFASINESSIAVSADNNKINNVLNQLAALRLDLCENPQCLVYPDLISIFR